jgi:hypothetical protein
VTNPVGNALAGLYYAFSIPLGLVNIVLNVIEGNQGTPNTPQINPPRADREWYSQPRIGSDPTVEVLQINFKLPLSISQLSFEALRLPCRIEVWYQDRNANWIPLTDSTNNPILVKMAYSAVTSWYDFTTEVYPVVGIALQLRISRVVDAQLGNNAYVVGLRETLIRRNVYSLETSTMAIEAQQDIIGNTVTSYVTNWDAADAIDDDPTTFWKSFPCPDPNGVVALYLDLRDGGGNPQMIDTVYLDPVYDGQALNLYYSNDPTMGTTIISSVQLPPDSQVNVAWTLSKGLVDSSNAGLSDSSYTFPVAWGPMVSEPIWIGIEWTPDFDPSAGPPDNPVIFGVTPEDPSTAAEAGQFWPQIYYDVGAGELTLEFTNGTTAHSFSVALSPTFSPGVPMEIVVGWNYGPSVVHLSVRAQSSGLTLASQTTSPATTLPALITLDGSVGYTNFRGLMTALVVKMEPWANGEAAFQSNATIYANPNPVLPDSQGNFPSTSLDNAILAADWTSQQFPIGGTHETWFENKTWTPIFANYVTSKGNLFLPQKVSTSYLKLEFTNLTAEPYPVYDNGIQVSYDTFPVAVIQQATNNAPGGLLGVIDGVLTLGADIVGAAMGAINWLNPATVQNMTNANFGNTQSPVQVVTGQGIVTGSIPNTAQTNINGMYRSEQSSPYIYPRSILNSTFLAGQQIATITGDTTSQTMTPALNASQTTVANSFTPVTASSKSNVLPQQGTDWWLFPGANLKMPASTMNALFGSTQVTTARGPSMATRVRFSGVSVHRYQINTVTLDAAVAYFAGIAEVSAYVTTYISGNDPLSFSYTQYDPTQFTYTNIAQEATGPLTTSGSPYTVPNPDFLPPLDLDHWTPTGAWFWDPTHGLAGQPCAGVVANGSALSLLSDEVAVNPGDQIVVSAWVTYQGAVSTSSGHISLGAVGYNAGTSIGAITLVNPVAGNGTTITNPTGDIDGLLFQQLIGTYTVPGSGVTAIAPELLIDTDVTAGTTYWGNVQITPAAGIEGTVFLDATTTSTFDRLNCVFTDSGLVTSDAMWAQADPLDTNIDNLQLAYYVNTFPSVIPSGVWADTFAEWGDTTIDWGEPLSTVIINIDPNLVYNQLRAVHFTRAAGAGNAGVIITQQTNMISEALAQLGCVFYKPTANSNQISVLLRRVSDGVIVHQETFTPVVGTWYTWQGGFFELPDSTDQVYTIEFLATGDDADEIYLNNLYTSVAGVRYFVQLGGDEEFLFDVTPLRYGNNNCQVSCTAPVQEFALTVGVFASWAWCYGASLTPHYLR